MPATLYPKLISKLLYTDLPSILSQLESELQQMNLYAITKNGFNADSKNRDIVCVDIGYYHKELINNINKNSSAKPEIESTISENECENKDSIDISNNNSGQMSLWMYLQSNYLIYRNALTDCLGNKITTNMADIILSMTNSKWNCLCKYYYYNVLCCNLLNNNNNNKYNNNSNNKHFSKHHYYYYGKNAIKFEKNNLLKVLINELYFGFDNVIFDMLYYLDIFDTEIVQSNLDSMIHVIALGFDINGNNNNNNTKKYENFKQENEDSKEDNYHKIDMKINNAFGQLCDILVSFGINLGKVNYNNKTDLNGFGNDMKQFMTSFVEKHDNCMIITLNFDQIQNEIVTKIFENCGIIENNLKTKNNQNVPKRLWILFFGQPKSCHLKKTNPNNNNNNNNKKITVKPVTIAMIRIRPDIG